MKTISCTFIREPGFKFLDVERVVGIWPLPSTLKTRELGWYCHFKLGHEYKMRSLYEGRGNRLEYGILKTFIDHLDKIINSCHVERLTMERLVTEWGEII